MASDPRVYGAILRTLLIIVVAVPIQFVLGMALAYLFMNRFPGYRFFYSLMLTPMMIVPAVVGLMFFLLFQSTGPINEHLGLPANFAWLTHSSRALIAIIVADTWQWTPLMFLMLLAGMMSVPPDQLMAAKLLGASNWQSFRTIILPRMKSVIVIALVLRVVESFKIFDLVNIMTNGGPGVQTETISMLFYKVTFGEFEWAYVASIGLVILVVLSLLASLGLSFFAKKKA
ncbi:sugar ABC transporter permease [Phaeobacter sp. PT47_59]|uniref:carbohydrate ABC transporter permease n=1 Tax=Phaeobacter sp. PT47_59 TaxID=3029979 RepID=UPI0023807984|nr:sugar ABC transporter permease [Phaeobacter sp. PT47_59]MDE4175422.1 sugar ABC transporter permease [Phaeobacter sp. PT47_59]